MNFLIIAPRYAPVAKLDKAPVYETGDYKFESCQVHHDLAKRALSSFAALPQNIGQLDWQKTKLVHIRSKSILSIAP